MFPTKQLDDGYIVDIQRKFGDHLYSKSDFTGAMAQYILTIGTVSIFFPPAVS